MKIKHLYLNSSALALYRLCPTRFAGSYIHGLERKGVDPSEREALDIGTLIHGAIDEHRAGRNWELYLDTNAPESIRKKAAHQAKSITHLRRLCSQYFEYWEASKLDIAATELQLEAPLTDRVTLVGSIDKLAYLDDGRYAIVDHKTSGNIARNLQPEIKLREQFAFYWYLATANGYEIDTFIIDAISTDKTVLDRNGELFERYELTKSPEEIAAFTARTKRIAERMIEDIESMTFDSVRGGTACRAYFRLCPFANMCEAPTEEAAASILVNSFEKKPVKNFRLEWEDSE